MSIVDALLRAKRIAQGRADSTNSSVVHQPARGPARGILDPTTDPLDRLPDVRASVPPQERKKSVFAVLPYDVSACATHRIVVPEVESVFSKSIPSYRMLRTRLLHRCRVSSWTMLGITSPGPGEGKSMTALNLAINVAREGNHDVFLLDLDMRNPSAARYLGVTPRADISEFLSGHAPVEDIFFTVGIDRLTLAANGEAVENASELLATDCFVEMLRFIKRVSARSLVILDLPPVVNTDDALMVAPRVDAMALVVSEGQTRRDGLQRAIGLLADFTMAGVILNRASESLGYEYYGRY